MSEFSFGLTFELKRTSKIIKKDYGRFVCIWRYIKLPLLPNSECLRVSSGLTINFLQCSLCAIWVFPSFLSVLSLLHPVFRLFLKVSICCLNVFCIRQSQIQPKDSIKDVCGIRSVFKSMNISFLIYKMIGIIIPTRVYCRRNEVTYIEMHSTVRGPVLAFNKCPFYSHHLCVKLACNW